MPKTTSLEVARIFGKRHDNVELRRIRLVSRIEREAIEGRRGLAFSFRATRGEVLQEFVETLDGNFLRGLDCPDIVWQASSVQLSRRKQAMSLEQEPKSERIDVRTTPRVKRTLQDAATASSKTVSEFLLDSALTRAAEVLADQRSFLVNDEQWEAFWTALDAPSPPMPRLEKLLREPSVLEKAADR